MKQTPIVLFYCSLFLWIGALTVGPVATANEGTGGQVKTTGKISFYEDETVPSSTESIEPSSEKPKAPNKPSEKDFPSTGELVKRYGLIGGGLLLLLFLILFFRKRKKEETE